MRGSQINQSTYQSSFRSIVEVLEQLSCQHLTIVFQPIEEHSSCSIVDTFLARWRFFTIFHTLNASNTTTSLDVTTHLANFMAKSLRWRDTLRYFLPSLLIAFFLLLEPLTLLLTLRCKRFKTFSDLRMWRGFSTLLP